MHLSCSVIRYHAYLNKYSRLRLYSHRGQVFGLATDSRIKPQSSLYYQSTAGYKSYCGPEVATISGAHCINC